MTEGATGAAGGAEVPWQNGQEGAALLAEEIRLLVEMVAEHALPWLEDVLAGGHGFGHTGAETREQQAREGASRSAPSCAWCPLCAVVALARGQRPEFAARLFEQVAQVVALLRAVLADRWEPDGGVHMPGFRPAEQPEEKRESGRVQHITVRRRAEWDQGPTG